MKICFVTGATGFLGLNFVEEVLKNNHFDTMYCMVRESSSRIRYLRNIVENHKDSSDVKTEICFGDVSILSEVEEAFPEVDVGCVFHIAGNIDMTNEEIEQQNKTNITGTKNMVEMSLKKKVGRFIYVSSAGVYYGDADKTDLSKVVEFTEESEKLAATSAENYGKSKYFGELEVHKGVEEGLDAVILQPAMVVGENDFSKDKTFNFFVKEMKHKSIEGITDGRVVITDVQALARVMISAYHRGKTGEEYIIGGPDATYEDIMKICFENYGYEKLLPQMTFRMMWWIGVGFEVYTCLRNRVCCCLQKKKYIPPLSRGFVYFLYTKVKMDSSKAVDELGYEIIELKETISRVCKWIDFLEENEQESKKME